ncbi:efflux RND transporter permease subunit [Aurantibacillus circumpalustris]|uniref:efflux RND transporter permease subunit n=1 Tax=Aurantibacillus circumpalustris TaxID=3036359 RepID=UPI00295A5E45|nr:MMPL family transporter [Aurantibacillus circumpalustris]
MVLGGFVPIQTPLLHFEDESAYLKDSSVIYNSPFLVGSYFPQNAQSLSLFIKTDDVLTKKQCDQLAESLESSIQKYRFDGVHMVGRIFAQNIYLVNLQKEFSVFLLISFVLVLIFLWFSFRSIYGIIVPVTIVIIAILWTLGIMDLMGKSIDIMSAMLPTMIFVAGMSDVIHFFSKYFEELSKGTEPQKVYKLVVKEVGFPTFLTLVTTVVGFLSLLFSSIQPIREFGIYTSVGVTMAFILTYTLLPALLHFFKPKKLIKTHSQNNRSNNLLQKGLFLIFRNQKTILLVTSIVIVVSVIGINKIKINNILLEDLSDKVKLKQDFNFFDKNYSGVRPFELSVTVSDTNHSVWDYEVITELYKLDEFIKKEYNAGFILSPAGMVKNIYVSSVNDAGDRFPDKEDYESIASYFKKNKKNKDIKRLVSEDGRSTRISGKIADLGSIKINEHDKNLLAYIEKNINKDLFHFEITGAAHLIDRNNEYMVKNMTQGFVFSIIVIGLLTFFLHRSWRMVVVFIIPNIIPLIVIGGIMGYAGIELKAATSLVFSIAFGIATDDTIHFISRLKIELAYGKSLIYAFKRTYFETGKPIVLTTFILMGGFMSLMISNFESTFYFGFLICITVIVALIADLFLLPVLLLAIYRKK